MSSNLRYALSALKIAADVVSSVRAANEIINAEGAGSAPEVIDLRRRVRAEMGFARDELDRDIEEIEAREAAEQASTTDESGP
jgi:phage-related minor tail protein